MSFFCLENSSQSSADKSMLASHVKACLVCLGNLTPLPVKNLVMSRLRCLLQRQDWWTGSYVVGVLAQAAVTKYYKLSGLNNESSFLPVLEAGKSKIKVPA